MKYYLFSNAIGDFIFDENINLVEKIDDSADLKEIKDKYNPITPEYKVIAKILAYFKDAKYYQKFHDVNMDLTRQSLKDAVKQDSLMIQAIESIQDLDKIANSIAKRLREWYELYNPEFSKQNESNEVFAAGLVNAEKKEPSVGADFTETDLAPIKDLAVLADSIFKKKKELEDYIGLIMDKECPNLKAIAGVLIGAKLISHAGSLKHLSELPASTVQLIGAEKALFRHMSKGSRPPKYGIIYQHQFIQKASKDLKGKAARLLADKISIAVKVDYFKGEFIADKLKKEIETKIKA